MSFDSMMALILLLLDDTLLLLDVLWIVVELLCVVISLDLDLGLSSISFRERRTHENELRSSYVKRARK